MILRKAATVSTPVIDYRENCIDDDGDDEDCDDDVDDDDDMDQYYNHHHHHHKVMEITAAGDIWSIKTSTTLKSMDLKFKVEILSS